MNKWKKRLGEFLSWEIAIEYKACLYFCCIVFFYFAWLICHGIYAASILFMVEMILTAYFIGYLQVYVFHNFDEAESLGKREWAEIFFCAGIYTAVSWGFGWYDRSMAASLLFLAFLLLCYFCIFLINKIKRDADTEKLNRMLAEYKEGEEHE